MSWYQALAKQIWASFWTQLLIVILQRIINYFGSLALVRLGWIKERATVSAECLRKFLDASEENLAAVNTFITFVEAERDAVQTEREANRNRITALEETIVRERAYYQKKLQSCYACHTSPGASVLRRAVNTTCCSACNKRH